MRIQRVAPIIAAIWAAGVGLFFLLGPVYGTSTSEYSVTPTGGQVVSREVQGHSSGLEVNGPHIVFVLSIPILLALLPLAAPRHQRTALLASGALLLVFCVLGALSVGTYYLPSALLLLVAGAITKEGSAPAT